MVMLKLVTLTRKVGHVYETPPSPHLFATPLLAFIAIWQSHCCIKCFSDISILFCFIQIRSLCQRPSENAPKWLQQLNRNNHLRPAVWAKHRKKKSLCGVSIGCPNFLRPLYLYTKLRQLDRVKNKPIPLKHVKAYEIDKSEKKQPCFTCQRYFGFNSFPIIGNCAEYDVIGKIDLHFLDKQQWQEFELGCQQHLHAFNAMKEDIVKCKISPEEIIKKYFKSTRDPSKPKVLKYQWSPKTMGGFEEIAMDWPLTKPSEQ